MESIARVVRIERRTHPVRECIIKEEKGKRFGENDERKNA
jgi:hypothetical protein